VRPLEQFLDALVDAFVAPATHDVPGLGIRVAEVRLDLPVEARLAGGASVELSLPRGRLATGFDRPRSRIRVELTGIVVAEDA
jgi:hypothetical protein